MAETREGRAVVKAKVAMTAAKIHGPNSPQVLSGEVPLGHRERVEMDEGDRLVEMTYDQAASMFGEEAAETLFRHVPKEER